MTSYTTNWILLMLLSAIWGGAFTLNKFALEAYSPEVLVTGRLLIASIVLLGFVLIVLVCKYNITSRHLDNITSVELST